MSKDIRSFFSLKKVQKLTVEDDVDVIPESPDVQIKNKKKESRKKRIIDDDSDEERKGNKKRSNDSSSAHKNKNKSKTELKEVKVVDLFGKAPIKRTEPLIKKAKKQTETGIHSDEEFEKSLLEIDGIEELDVKGISDNVHDSKANKISPEACEINNKSKSDDTFPIVIDSEPSTSSDAKIKPQNNNIHDLKVNNKRKFAEFTETEVKYNGEIENIKRKKLVENNKSEIKTNGMVKDSEEYSDSSAFEDEDQKKNKKTRLNKSLNESALTDEERHERKIHSAALYQKYLNRPGPKHLGAKQMQEGSPGCLKDCAFLLTGVLDSFERDEIVEAINKYGGCVKNTISKKVTHILAGDDAGPAKMAKAQELGIKILSEDDFLKIIENSRNIVKVKSEAKSENKKDKIKSSRERKCSKEKHLDNSKDVSKTSLIDSAKKLHVKQENSNKLGDNIKNHEKSKSPKVKDSFLKDRKKKSEKDAEATTKNKEIKSDVESNSRKTTTSSINEVQTEDEKPDQNVCCSMWVEKYKPQNVKQIIGQHGDASNVKKLTNWLTKWYVNRKAKLAKPSPWAKNDDGGYYKAALLSGPPGVGKTTTVALVCKELGFDVVEFNASDTRNRTLIKEQIGELLTTTSLSAYAKGDTGKQAVTKKHALVMDEVDGMAGNEDRGGLQELINLIKSTSVPIICMCNDRNSQKMRSLVNYCYDLRFNRPRVDQIKSAMMSICFKEGIKIPPDVISQLIVSANQDVRQTLNLLSMWAVDPHLADTERLKRDASTVKKDVKLGPWEAIRKVFSAEDHKTMSIHDRSDLFFYDYSLAPLFVQENYLQVAPHCPKHEVMQRVSEAADSISVGDIVDARIRGRQAWSLLPVQAMYSSVIPGHALSGHVTGQIQFPGWLGKNSRASKMHRLCQEIHSHTRLSTSGSKSSIFLDYCTHLRDAIVSPLIKDKSAGIDESLQTLEAYHLLRDDLESLVELSLWPGQRNPTILIDSKVKAAMTRTYNKMASALPYAPGAIKRGHARDDDVTGEEDDDCSEEADSDPDNDALIKKRKVKDAEKPSSSKDNPTKSKAKPSKDKNKKK